MIACHKPKCLKNIILSTTQCYKGTNLQVSEFVTNDKILDIINIKEIAEKVEHIFTENLIVEKIAKHI